MTCTGPGKAKCVAKAKDGRIEEWTYEACSEGMTLRGTDKVTGQSCKIVLERFLNVFGDYRIVTTVNMDEFLKTLGNLTLEVVLYSQHSNKNIEAGLTYCHHFISHCSRQAIAWYWVGILSLLFSHFSMHPADLMTKLSTELMMGQKLA